MKTTIMSCIYTYVYPYLPLHTHVCTHAFMYRGPVCLHALFGLPVSVPHTYTFEDACSHESQ